MSSLTDFQAKCDKITSLLKDDFASVKTGRAKPDLVQNMSVSVYGGTWMKIQELASVSAPDPQSLIITPWDRTVLKDLEKGIYQAGVNLQPVIDGNMIRIYIPPLTEETRKDLVKLIKQKVESHKAMLRQERSNYKRLIEAEKGHNGISEDDIKKNLETLQDITDATVENLDNLTKQKEAELMKV